MKSILLSVFILTYTAVYVKAQSAQNLILYPSPVMMYGTLNVQYDLYNNTTAPISGVVSTSAKINGIYKGVINSYTLPAPVLPGQTMQIHFVIPVNPPDFNSLGNNIIIIWPTGEVTEDNDSATASVYVTQQD